MDIVITGANGAVGTALIRYLSVAAPLGATRLRALVRSPARARSLHALGAEIVVVDYRQPETWQGAVAGAEVVVHLAGALLEVKEGRIFHREGHARWSTYLRAFVPMTPRWCQLEMKRARALRDHPVLAEAWRRVGYDVAVQGNLDPVVLLGPRERIRARVEQILRSVNGRPGHIFNLGHGILPETPVENVQAVVEMVRQFQPVNS